MRFIAVLALGYRRGWGGGSKIVTFGETHQSEQSTVYFKGTENRELPA
jgi:hypothetical protein